MNPDTEGLLRRINAEAIKSESELFATAAKVLSERAKTRADGRYCTPFVNGRLPDGASKYDDGQIARAALRLPLKVSQL